MGYRHTRRQSEPGLIKKHLLGDYSLARSYWLHTLVFGWGLAIVGAYAFHKIGERYAVRYVAMAVIAFQPLALLVWLWSVVGTWMSALKHLFSGGSKFWAIAAMLSVAGGAFGMMRELPTMRAFMEEHWEVAKGKQPTDGFSVTLVDNGRTVAFKGGVNEGAAAALDKAIADAPNVTTVSLDSPGGWLKEGKRMADVVRRYRLHTHVDHECFSSCTLVLLAGLDKGFVSQILATPNAQIWVPTRRQLLSGQVLTR